MSQTVRPARQSVHSLSVRGVVVVAVVVDLVVAMTSLSAAALALSLVLVLLASSSSAPASRYDRRQEGDFNARVHVGHYILLLIPLSSAPANPAETTTPAVYDLSDFPKRALPKKYYKPEEKAAHEIGLGGNVLPAAVLPVEPASDNKGGHKSSSVLSRLHPVVQDISSDVLIALSPSVALAKTQPVHVESVADRLEKKSDFVKDIFVPAGEITGWNTVKNTSKKSSSLADKFVKDIFVSEEVPFIDFVVPAATVNITKKKNSLPDSKIDQIIFSQAVPGKETLLSDPAIISVPIEDVEQIPAHEITLEHIKKAKSISATLTILQKEPAKEPEAAETAEEVAIKERERIVERIRAGMDIEICTPDQERDAEGNCTAIKTKKRNEPVPLPGRVALVSGLSFGLSPAYARK